MPSWPIFLQVALACFCSFLPLATVHRIESNGEYGTISWSVAQIKTYVQTHGKNNTNKNHDDCSSSSPEAQQQQHEEQEQNQLQDREEKEQQQKA
jgi:hypothetical protein